MRFNVIDPTKLDATPFVLLLCWWAMRYRLDKQWKDHAASLSNRHSTYLLFVSSILQVCFFFSVTVILFILAMVLFKLLLLEPIAHISNGYYPFSIEYILRTVLFKVFSSISHISFHLTLFFVVCVYAYIAIMLVFDATHDQNIKKNQFFMVIDTMPVIYAVFYALWLGTSSPHDDPTHAR
jgi:hypothetical protein